MVQASDAGYDKAFTILSSSEANPQGEQMLQFTAAQTQEWDIPLAYIREEQAFTNTTNWQQISRVHNLDSSAFILFYRPIHCLHTGHHYLNEFDRKEEYHFPEFKVENFLFQLELDKNGYAK